MKKQVIGCAILAGLLVFAGKTILQPAAEAPRVLYESEALGIGFLIPQGYAENPFRVEESETENGVLLSFREKESDAEVFAIYRMNAAYWDAEVQPNFSIPYTEIERAGDDVLLCLNATDVQAADAETAARCQALWETRAEVCDSLYATAG